MTSFFPFSGFRFTRVSPPAASGTASLSLTWDDNSAIEDGFRVRYRTAGSGSYTLATTTAANVETATITGLAFGTNYDVTVAAFNGSGEYSVVGPVTRYTPPQYAPTGLTLAASRNSEVDLTCTAPSTAPSGYAAYYRIPGASTWTIGGTSATTSVTVSGLQSLTAYQFMVRGFLENAVPQTPSYSPDSSTVSGSTSSGWSAPLSIAAEAESVVSTEGTLVVANNFGEETNRTVNGVTFTGVITKGNMTNVFADSALFVGTSLTADFAAMLRCLVYTYTENLGQFTLTGLIPGDTYLLQVFSTDSRAVYGERSQTIEVAGLTSSANVLQTQYAMTCKFVASATSHTVSIDDPANPTGANHINAFQLRKL